MTDALLVCPACYALLVSKEHQPYATSTQRLRRLLGLRSRSTRREVVTHARIWARQPVAAGRLTLEQDVRLSRQVVAWAARQQEVRHASAIR